MVDNSGDKTGANAEDKTEWVYLKNSGSSPSTPKSSLGTCGNVGFREGDTKSVGNAYFFNLGEGVQKISYI